MRSRTGCLTCRQRKLKCDETKPVCSNCRKGSRECRLSDGVVFRHQQNASMNGDGEVDESNGQKLGGFYAYKNTFNEKNVWVEVPKKVTFYNVTDPYNMEDTPEPEQQPLVTFGPQIEERTETYCSTTSTQATGLEALSTAATANFAYMRPAGLSPGDMPHSANNINFILNPAGPERHMGIIDRSFSKTSLIPEGTASPKITPASPSIHNESQVVDEHEVAFLLRHFGETPGQWMDLYDLECYFAHHVPVAALSNPLLRFSACAYAAKQLFRVRGRKAVVGGVTSRPSDMELYPRPESVDWEWIGAKYYDKAISLLMDELSNTGVDDPPMTPMASMERTLSPQQSNHSPHSVPRSDPRTTRHKRMRLSRPAASNNADETLAAAAILCVYEFLDYAHNAWARHLSGTKSLFDLAENEGMMPVQSPLSPGTLSYRIKPSRARRATFWNFARQDFLAAFINESQTRLNPSDLGLWRAAGLQLDEEGFVIPSNTEDSRYPDRQISMREDMISNALIFLMSKIINFIASGDSVDHVFPQNLASPSGVNAIPQMLILERWKELERELETWHAGLPNTFKPCARLPPVTNGSVFMDSARAIFPEIWYSIPMCGSTMQSYHMARTILLINQPQESSARRSTLSGRFYSYGQVRREVRYHVHEICGIALGRPDGSVRIHQVQALFVAGQCMEDERERRVLLDLLREIESDLGWATDYRVQKLLKEWGWREG